MHQQDGLRRPADMQSTPRHIAIIMDGNGRWAAARGLPRAEGHRRGVEAVRACVRAAGELGVEHLTLFSFSSENWRRPLEEINDLMGLLRRFIRRDLAELHEQDVRVRVIGAPDGVPDDIRKLIAEAVALTRDNGGLRLTVAFNYGARDEIVRAARKLARQAVAGEMDAGSIDEAAFGAALDTAGLPDPDLLIRTSGEMRISNFLLWQCAYAEMVFADAYWPDFDKDALIACINEYQTRERRFGGLSARYSA
ncbi:MAG: isoprenyl transferase [Hyphomicrobiales bacterium]|nr:isoprenyl transferase [Hyphomicrobiales bacterium]